jgi:protein TonB
VLRSQSSGESGVQNNQEHLRFRRRGIPTAGEAQQKSKFGLILTASTVVILLPVMIYGLTHTSQVSTTVKQIARHVSMPVRDLRVAVVAMRSTPRPAATPTPAPTATPAPTPKETVAKAHARHLKRLHARTLAEARAKKVASADQSSDVAGSQVTGETASHGTLAANPAANSGSALGTEVTPAPAPTAATVAAAQAPEADATPVYAPDVVVDARFTHAVQPDYPPIAKAQGASGTAVVLATIGPDGKVISAHIDQSTGNKMLDEAALDAAKASGFQPPIINGKPATETYRLVYNFEL